MEVATVIIPGQRYIVWSASITYNSVLLNIGDEFIGVSGVTTYTGSGYASEIIAFNETSLEGYVFEDIIFPDQISVNESSIEIVQSLNGTIYPEQITVKNTFIEVAETITDDAKIIYSEN